MDNADGRLRGAFSSSPSRPLPCVRSGDGEVPKANFQRGGEEKLEVGLVDSPHQRRRRRRRRKRRRSSIRADGRSGSDTNWSPDWPWTGSTRRGNRRNDHIRNAKEESREESSYQQVEFYWSGPVTDRFEGSSAE